MKANSWGDVSEYVCKNYQNIQKMFSPEKGSIVVFRELESSSGFPAASIQRAYTRITQKKSKQLDLEYRKHGNQLLTKKQESLLFGYSLMCSEVGAAPTISDLCNFSKHLVGFELSHRTLSRFLKQRSNLLRITSARGMSKARISAQSIDDMKSFIVNYQELMGKYQIGDNHLVNADETLLRGGKDCCSLK